MRVPTHSLLRWVSLLALCAPLWTGVARAEEAAPADPTDSLAVLPVATKLAEPGATDTAVLLTASLTARLGEINAYKVISATEVAELLRNEQDRQSMGCSDASCLAELAGALGAKILVTGELLRVGTDYVWSASLVNQVDGTVMERAQSKGRTLQALAAQVEEMAYALMGRKDEVSLDNERAQERLGFASASDLKKFKAYRGKHLELTTGEALTQFILDHNIESNRLAIMQAIVFAAASGIPGLVMGLAFAGYTLHTTLHLGILAVPLVAGAFLVAPLGIALLTTGVVLAIVDALNLGHIKVKATGCCRQDDQILDEERSNGIRRAAAMSVLLSGGFAIMGMVLAGMVPSMLNTALPRVGLGYAPGLGGAYSQQPLSIALDALSGPPQLMAMVGVVTTAPVTLVIGLCLLLWPGASVVAGLEAE